MELKLNAPTFPNTTVSQLPPAEATSCRQRCRWKACREGGARGSCQPTSLPPCPDIKATSTKSQCPNDATIDVMPSRWWTTRLSVWSLASARRLKIIVFTNSVSLASRLATITTFHQTLNGQQPAFWASDSILHAADIPDLANLRPRRGKSFDPILLFHVHHRSSRLDLAHPPWNHSEATFHLQALLRQFASRRSLGWNSFFSSATASARLPATIDVQPRLPQ